jgi:hypothetical protein
MSFLGNIKFSFARGISLLKPHLSKFNWILVDLIDLVKLEPPCVILTRDKLVHAFYIIREVTDTG